jgi:hypothetical protein
MPPYDVCIPYHPKDSNMLEHCIVSIRQYLLEAQTIYIISKENPQLEDTVWIPESQYPFTKEDVAKVISFPPRVGWYYQQLLKLYCYRILPSTADRILLLDSDVVFKKNVDFFEGEVSLFAISPEHHEPYFKHMTSLLPHIQKQSKYSGIVHHMLTKKTHMEHLLSTIESIHAQPAWKAILSVVDEKEYFNSGMSEYEIYFNYCLQSFPSEYKIRILPFANCSNFKEFKEVDVSLAAVHSYEQENV